MKFLYKNILTVCLAFCFTCVAQAQNLPINQPPANIVVLPVNHTKPYNSQGNSTPVLYNFSRQFAPIIPLNNVADVITVGINIRHSTTYSNGFGQPLERIDWMTDFLHDMVTTYDNRSTNSTVSYLSYPAPRNSKFQMSPFMDQISYYQGIYPDEQGISFSLQVDTSISTIPTSSSYQAGADLAGTRKGTQTTTTYNIQNDGVKIWRASQSVAVFGEYDEGTLTKKIITNADGGRTEEFYDKDNQLILRQNLVAENTWLKTYYVYNDLGKIVTIITPKAVAQLELNGYDLTQDIQQGLCYNYQYDNYGQEISTRKPDQGDIQTTVMDALHRPVLIQTPLLKQSNQWEFTIYDHRDNVIFSGLFTTTEDGKTLQQEINDGQSNPGTIQYYTINGFDGNYSPLIGNLIPNCDVRQINYYDTYNQDPEFPNATFYSYPDFLTGPQFVTPIPSKSTWGLLTGSKTNVVGGGLQNKWISKVFFYDNHGRLIQTQTKDPFNDNGQIAKKSTQYQFDGKVTLVIDEHFAWKAANKSSTKVVKKINYDYNNGGRISKVQLNIDNSPNWRELADYNYNDLDQVSYKNLGLVEHQNLRYNIRSQLTSVNKDYIYDPTCNDYTNMTFGEQIAYESGFNNVRTDGGISGFIWRGSGVQRAYGYNYDYAGRMTSADFRQWEYNPNNINGYDWNNTYNDYSVSNVTYDPNGNLLSLKQRGVEFGQVQDIDDLSYTYSDNSNRLDNVTDAVTTQFPDLNDFTDNNTGNGDYSYDSDGNLTLDANKGISIIYNYLDLPTTVRRVYDRIDNIYAGDGSLLQKTIQANGQTDVYRYWGDFVYRNDSLLYLLNDEGRCRWLADSNIFKYDYFVKDHLGNVRTTVTTDFGNTYDYLATHELASANFEHTIFDGMGLVTSPKPGSTDPNDQESAGLDGADPNKRIGTSILLHVMAGDRFNVSAQSFYDNTGDNTGADAGSVLASIIGTLVNGPGALNPGEAGQNADIVNHLFTNSNYIDVYDGIIQSATDPELPRAYLNYVVFDEDMRIVPEQSGAIQVGSTANAWENIELANDIAIAKNGYLAVYLSDQQNKKVWFDNMQITFYRGRLLEENHYYPHGLVINGGMNNPIPNRFKYQGKELQDELGMQLYDFHARQYDPQIGRFWGIDPADQFPSGYTGMANDPANNIDPTGMIAKGIVAGQSLNNLQSQHNVGGVSVDLVKFEYDMQSENDAIRLKKELEAAYYAYRNAVASTGNPTIYYTSDGNYSGNIPDGSQNVAIFNPGFDKAGTYIVNNYKYFTEHGFKPQTISAYANKMALVYDIPAFSKFYDENSTKVEAKTLMGSSISDGVDYKYILNDGTEYSLKHLYAEVSANLIFRDNVITVGNVTGTNYNVQNSPNSYQLAGEPGKINDIGIHLHPFDESGTIISYIPTQFGHMSGGPGGPIGAGANNDDRPRSQSNKRSVTVDKRNIYLYNNSSIITIPRK